jgi:outer membrane protein TolC
VTRSLAAALLLVPAVCARAQAAAAAETPLFADPVLTELVAQSLAARPELRQAEATVRAGRERSEQAGALPDPILTLGIQNDGFQEIQIGKMETSFWQVMITQPLPWPGKRDLRTGVARQAEEEAQAGLSRARLGAEADVRRAYLDLLVARDRLELLGRLESLWKTSAGVARARYESGEGAQSDVLRAQLELNRIRQRRVALQAQETGAIQTLNRLRARPVLEPIATTAGVARLGAPEPAELEAGVSDALARSPELAQARAAAARARAGADLARRERYPDLAVSAGIMPRGQLEPMWTAAISIGLPVWSGRKQGRAVAESEARAEGGAHAEQALDQIVRLRVAERRNAALALLDTVKLYREGLLVQSRATAESTLAQYRVGKVSFASVLEANAGLVADEDGYLGAVADAQRVAIAAAEVSLEPASGPGAAPMARGGMPGAGAIRSGGAGAGAGAESGGAEAAAGAMAPGM